MNPSVNLLWTTPDPEYQVVRATRICYASEDKSDSHWQPTDAMQHLVAGAGLQVGVPLMKVKIGPEDEKLLRRIMQNEHNTCLRFASAAFHISNISRVCSHQLVRVAHFGILQRSQRYCNEGETQFSMPDSMHDEVYMEYLEKGRELYDKAIREGKKKEDARYLLPSASDTQINMVSNFQGWKHFLDLRVAKKAQKEIRDLAALITFKLYEVAPIIFESDRKRALDLGYKD